MESDVGVRVRDQACGPDRRDHIRRGAIIIDIRNSTEKVNNATEAVIRPDKKGNKRLNWR